MIYWYESIDEKPENVNGESLRKMLKSRYKIKISPSCADFYENKHLCICPFSKEMGVSRVLMADDLDALQEKYNASLDDI